MHRVFTTVLQLPVMLTGGSSRISTRTLRAPALNATRGCMPEAGTSLLPCLGPSRFRRGSARVPCSRRWRCRALALLCWRRTFQPNEWVRHVGQAEAFVREKALDRRGGGSWRGGAEGGLGNARFLYSACLGWGGAQETRPFIAIMLASFESAHTARSDAQPIARAMPQREAPQYLHCVLEDKVPGHLRPSWNWDGRQRDTNVLAIHDGAGVCAHCCKFSVTKEQAWIQVQAEPDTSQRQAPNSLLTYSSPLKLDVSCFMP